jgi:hypothetical protein
MTDAINYDPYPYAIGSETFPGFSKLIEELGELNQVIGQILARGSQLGEFHNHKLATRLVEEMADTAAAIMLVIEGNKLNPKDFAIRRHNKYNTYRRWQAQGIDAWKNYEDEFISKPL